jgi:hypothetical protein
MSISEKGKAIRNKCLECCGGSAKEVTLCPIEECPLWEHRFGYNVDTRKGRERIEKACAAE